MTFGIEVLVHRFFDAVERVHRAARVVAFVSAVTSLYAPLVSRLFLLSCLPR